MRPTASLLLLAALASAGVPRFREITVSNSLKMGYQLVVADLNCDGKPDLIVVDERSTELAWFENPTWERHVLAVDVPRTINLEVWDWDSDGKPDIAMAHGFETNPEKSAGIVLLLKCGPDPRRPWTKQEIDRVPTAHRLRWIDPRGDGKKLLLVAPLVGLKARAPAYDDRAPVYLYKPGEWKRILLTDQPYGVLHSIAPVPWKGRGEQLFTASFSGLQLFSLSKEGPWTGLSIAKGDPRPCPQCGSSEVKAGRLGKTRFLAAIEPWHGSQIVVYSPSGRGWTRNVIETGMVNGHALAVGDLDGDGRDEIVAGFRGQGFHVMVFHFTGTTWVKETIDSSGLAAADCKIADFNGDRRPDIACSGASTGNIKIYETIQD
jgi:hypothetical protein